MIRNNYVNIYSKYSYNTIVLFFFLSYKLSSLSISKYNNNNNSNVILALFFNLVIYCDVLIKSDIIFKLLLLLLLLLLLFANTLSFSELFDNISFMLNVRRLCAVVDSLISAANVCDCVISAWCWQVRDGAVELRSRQNSLFQP